MGSNRLDRFIKEKVQNHETVVDKGLFWQKIQAKQQAQKKSRRRFFFLWFFVGLLVFSSGLGLFFYLNQPAANTILSNVESLETNDPKQISLAVENPISNGVSIENNINQNPKDLSFDNDDQSQTEQAKIKRESSKNKPIKNPSTIQPFNGLKEIKTTVISEDKLIKTVNIDEKVNGITSKISSKNTTSTNNVSTVKNQYDFTIKRSDITAPSRLPLIKPVLEMSDFSNLDLPEETFKPNPKSSKSYKKYAYSIGAFSTYGKANRTLSSTNSDNYIRIRDSIETPKDVINFGFNFKIQQENNFYLKAGLEYQQINEKFEHYASSDSTLFLPNQVVAIVYETDGSSSEILGEGLVYESSFNSRKIYNRYRSIELPILIGYSSTNHKLNWFAEGGLALNLWFNPSGEILDESGTAISLKKDQSIFKSQTGLSLISSFGLTYRWSEKFSLNAGPNLKYQLSSVTAKQNSVNQKYFIGGLQIGLQYHW